MALSAFILLWNHRHHPSPFPSSQTETLHLIKDNSSFPILTAPATSILHSVSGNLILEVPQVHEQTAVFVLLCPAYSTQHSVFKFHPCCSMGHSSLPFEGGITFHCMYLPYYCLSIHLPGALGLFPSFGYCEYCCHCRLNVFVLPEFICGNLIPKVMVSRGGAFEDH